MSKKTILILFIISLAFNLAFFGTFLRHRVIPHHGPRDQMMGRPKLPKHSRKDFREFRKSMGEKHREYSKARNQFILALMEEDLIEEQVLERLKSAVEKQTAMEKEIGLSFIKLRKKMTPEEAKMFFRHDLKTKEKQQELMRGRKK
ncbi:MAG: hypothetical protein HOK80_00705 [Candidatus Cloacimonetes bacterium]|jgi:hypothetical protein|nr:hypothetical protein [Candidatus Cloacimonadota bacterium]MBT4332382.1 hypothetical protein [Candidatus Cloacimonadota bacterium]MBT4576677.1 hypothetical protein [Candidatus Cloacimonadota bacterium]MBT5419382.1 hypothetical protein [Candidatus Cloacimonadota bacterium]